MLIIPPKHPGHALIVLLQHRILQLLRNEKKQESKLHGQTQTKIENRLQLLHTKELLDMLAWHRLSSETYLEYDEETRKTIGDSTWSSKGRLAIIEEYALRKVLATRPHVPNKIEGKRNRQKLATQHHGSKKKRKAN
jgi:hypothetical protein